MNNLPVPPIEIPIIPDGYCQCGCGQKTALAPTTRSERKWIRGKPEPRLAGHHAKSPIDCLLDPVTGCWNWQRGKSKAGYGLIHVEERKIKLAHRVYYQLAHGPIPPGKFVCHACDNPSCVNPNHLFVGSQSDNMRDARKKGRTKNRVFRGEQHKNSKLTNDEVIAIRNSYTGRRGEIVRLSEKYGISASQIAYIVHRKSWRHI